MTVEELQVLVTANTRGLQSQMNDLTRRLQGVQRQSNTMSQGMARAFSGLKKTLIALGIGKMIKSMFDLSRTYEAATQQVNRIFRDNASAIEAWIDKNATMFGMARADAMQYASIYGNLVSGFESDTKRMSEYTTQLMEATSIIASSTGRTVTDVAERIRSGLLGNTESIEDLGVNVNVALLETTNAFKTLANGKSWEQLSFQTQQQIRLMAILEQTSAKFGSSIQQNTNYQLMQLTANLKNIGLNLGNAFMPIVSVVLPVLNSMALALANVTAKLAAFMNTLFGTHFNAGAGEVQQVAAGAGDAAQGYEDMSDAADDAGESAKKAGKAAKNAIMGFDEINQLPKDNGSGGKGGAGGGLPSDTGTQVSSVMSEAAESFASKVEDVINRLKNLFKEGFKIGLGDDIQNRLDDIKKHIQGIKDGLKNIFTSPEVVAAAQKLADSIALNLGKVTGSIASIGVTIAQNLLGGIDKYLSQNSEFIKQRLVGIMDATSEIANLAGNFAVAFADVFSVFGGETAQQITANIIGMFSNAALGALEVMAKLGADVLMAITQPFVDNKDLIKTTLEGMLVPIETITGTLKDTVTNTFETILSVYDERVHPAFENITTGLSNLVTNILENYNTYIAPVLDGLATKFDELMSGPVQGFIDACIENIGKLIENGSILWKDVFEPMIESFNSTLAPVLGDIVEKVGEFAISLGETLFNAATEVVNKIGEISDWCVEHKGTIEDIVSVIAAWTAAWGAFKLAQLAVNIAVGAWNAIAAVGAAVTGAFSAAIAFLTSPITLTIAAIAAVIAIVVLLIKHWDEVKEAAAKCWDWIVEKWNSAGEWFNSTVVEPIRQFFSNLWEGIKTKANETWQGIVSIWTAVSNWFNTTVIEPVKKFFSDLWEAIKTKSSEAWNNVKTAWNSACTWFTTTIVNPIKTKFTGAWDSIKQKGVAAFDGIKNGCRNAVNGIIGHINGLIGKINSIGFDMPEKLGGGHIGFNIPTIPKLARGGIVDGATFMGNYIAGEAGKEMIVPLENTAFVDKLASSLGNAVMYAMSAVLNTSSSIGGNNNQNVSLEMDGTVFARTVTPLIIKEMKRLGIDL